MTKPNSSLKPMVGTTNKSVAAISGVWLRKKVRHPWLGGSRRLNMYLGDARLRDLKPELEQFAVMRGAPQSGFSKLIRRINTRSAVSICGRPNLLLRRSSRLSSNYRKPRHAHFADQLRHLQICVRRYSK